MRTQQRGHVQREVGGGHPSLQPAFEANADHPWHLHRQRLAQHRRLSFDAADAPAEHAQRVDHRRVAVGTDQRVRPGDRRAAVDRLRHLHHFGKELQVDLMQDTAARRHHAEVRQALLRPPDEPIALCVAPEVDLEVEARRIRTGVVLHGDRMVDHQVDRYHRIHPRRIAAERSHRIAHGREVGQRRQAGRVVHQYACGKEIEFTASVEYTIGVHQRAQPGWRMQRHVLEQDAQRARQAVEHRIGQHAREIDATAGLTLRPERL